ncbi:hypothetical protein I6F35_09825 [Bradyrhizobium sp. BRP22]|uniref:hypothetical protein n=1 Tax=Bradyrhizobium sp. BRP22 TaxID=2793821 RepID=UPI001CD2774F|nr:hypothetical protein [Bradyrhizobium sp. BRP22]MCA1453512.1 hypothetical protein [Bradyrhizobium sp. BRP22]
MNWASSLDHIWRSATFPMWLTLAAAGFFGLILLITLLRAEKSVANGALTVITLLAIAIAVAATIRGFDSGSRAASTDTRLTQPIVAAPAALACIDDLAGDAVLNACEKVLFGSADSTAAAVAYAASKISRLTSLGDIATAERNTSPELQALRRAIERDRYGLMAYVLTVRDHCTPASCAAFSSLGTTQQIASNMDEHLYENLITRYAPSWNAPQPANTAAAAGAIPGAGVLGALPTSVPTGKPTNAEFPSAANTPPISIMSPEPASKPSPPAAAAATTPPAPRAAPAASTTPPAAAKKQAAAKRPPAPAPVPLAPAPPASTAAPAASDD